MNSISNKINIQRYSALALPLLSLVCGCSKVVSQAVVQPATTTHFVSATSQESVSAQTEHNQTSLPGLHIKAWSRPNEEPPGKEDFDGVASIAFSSDGKTLVSGGRDGFIRLWDSRTGRLRGIWQAGPGTVSGLAFSRDGSLLVDQVSLNPNSSLGKNTEDQANKAQVWDMRTHHLRWSCHANGLTDGVALSPDGRWLAVGDDVTYHLPTYYRLYKGDAGYCPVPNNTAKGGGVRVWDLTTGRLVRMLHSEYDFYDAPPWKFDPAIVVDHLHFSPDGRMLAGVALYGGNCGEPQYLQVWDTRSGQVQGFPDVLHTQGNGSDQSSEPEEVDTVAFSRQRHLFGSLCGGIIHVWDTRNGKNIEELTHGKDWSIVTLCFSPDGRFEADGSASAIDVRDTNTGRLVRRIPTQGRRIQAVAFSPDGHTVSSGSGNGWLEIWPVS